MLGSLFRRTKFLSVVLLLFGFQLFYRAMVRIYDGRDSRV